MSIPVLPEDIQHYMPEFLNDDIDSLKACSLVSRSWQREAQYQLFHEVSLVWVADFKSLRDHALASRSRFFQDTPAIARLVGVLRVIETGPRMDQAPLYPPELEYVERVFRDIYSFIGLLDNLRVVEFKDGCRFLSSFALFPSSIEIRESSSTAHVGFQCGKTARFR
ncbi:hypothetical protein K474DRAFT_1222525 [Panus rudis PR-1116 ss-1]|nr:hypothetical protein K474DRAFT_1222525 [Panus rudis PR-1116 ss-1]